MFYKKGVLRNFAKFTGNHLCQRHSFLINFIKKESLPQVLSSEFSEISKNTFFIEHLRWLLLCKVIYHHGTSNYIAKGDFDGVQVILLQVNIQKKYKLMLLYFSVFELPSVKMFLTFFTNFRLFVLTKKQKVYKH